MKRIFTLIPYSDLYNLARQSKKVKGSSAFIQLLRPALLEMGDEEISLLVSATTSWWVPSFGYPGRVIAATHILIIQEYVKRVAKSEEEERKTAERLEELKKAVREEKWYTEIKEKEDSSILNSIELKNLVDKKMRANQALEGMNLDEHLRWTNIWDAALTKFIFNLEQRRKEWIFDTEKNFSYADLYESPRMSGKHFEYFIQDDLISLKNKSTITKQMIDQTIQKLKEKEKKK